MHVLRRLFAWAFYLGFLAAIGAVVFFYVRHTPRCIILGPLRSFYWSEDGSRLGTYTTGMEGHFGPLQLWDTYKGQVIYDWVRDLPLGNGGFGVPAVTSSPRHVVVTLKDDTSQLLDLQTGLARPIGEGASPPGFEFSKEGRWLSVWGHTKEGQIVCLINPAEPQRVQRFETLLPTLVHRQEGQYFFGERFLLLAKSEEKKGITIWDLDAGRQVGTLDAVASACNVSPDGNALATFYYGGGQFVEGKAGPEVRRKGAGIEVLDLKTFQMRFFREVAVAGNAFATFSPDSRTLAYWFDGEDSQTDLLMLDAGTGKLLWTYPITKAGQPEFSADSSLFHISHAEAKGKWELTMFEAATGKVLWRRPATTGAFSGDTGRMLCHHEPTGLLEIGDARTGAKLAAPPLEVWKVEHLPWLVASGRQFVVTGSQKRSREPHFWEKWLERLWPRVFGADLPGALVMDSATGRELFRVANRGQGGWCQLSEDGSTLVTEDWSGPGVGMHVYSFWDIRPHRAYLWSLASVAAVMLVLFALSRAVRAWRSRKNP